MDSSGILGNTRDDRRRGPDTHTKSREYREYSTAQKNELGKSANTHHDTSPKKMPTMNIIFAHCSGSWPYAGAAPCM